MSQPVPGPYDGQYAQRPGSKPWIEQRYGRVADFTDRIVPGLVDVALSFVVFLVPAVVGGLLIAAGVPRSHDCGPYGMDSCQIPGSGSGALIALGVVTFVLALVLTFGFVCWNRIWRVHRSGQSLGKKVGHLRVIDAVHGTHPSLGAAIVRELIHQLAGIISWIWIFVDSDDRTLADIVGTTHVVHDPR